MLASPRSRQVLSVSLPHWAVVTPSMKLVWQARCWCGFEGPLRFRRGPSLEDLEQHRAEKHGG